MDEGIKKHIAELKHLRSLGILDTETNNQIDEALSELEKFDDEGNSVDNDFKIEIKYINNSDNENPIYAKEGDSGFDLRANEGGELKPLERRLVGTGLFFELPNGYELQIRPRSGLAYKNGITVLNTPGTVDTGYRGEIKVLLVNISNDTFTWEKGERIAQGVVASRVGGEFGELIRVYEINESERGSGGFGSTGVK